MLGTAASWVIGSLCSVTLLAVPTESAADACTTPTCVKALVARLHQSLGATTPVDFTRVWTRRGAGSYWLLYVLPDGTYSQTLIDDTGLHLVESGRWTAAQGVLALQPTGRGAPRRHVAVRAADARDRTLLVPVEELAEQFGAATTAVDDQAVLEWLDIHGLGGGRRVAAADLPKIRQELSRFRPVP